MDPHESELEARWRRGVTHGESSWGDFPPATGANVDFEQLIERLRAEDEAAKTPAERDAELQEDEATSANDAALIAEALGVPVQRPGGEWLTAEQHREQAREHQSKALALRARALHVQHTQDVDVLSTLPAQAKKRVVAGEAIAHEYSAEFGEVRPHVFEHAEDRVSLLDSERDERGVDVERVGDSSGCLEAFGVLVGEQGGDERASVSVRMGCRRITSPILRVNRSRMGERR